MRVEDIPVVLGVVVLLIGAAIMWDAWGPQTLGPMRERRRSMREALDLKGELTAGLGVVLLGAAIIGRDWRFETVTVIVGTVCIIVGALKNRKYFREVFLFRGASRRDVATESIKPDKLPRR